MSNRVFENCSLLGYYAASIGDKTEECSSHPVHGGSLKFNKLLTSIKSFNSKSKLAHHSMSSAHNEDKAVSPTRQCPSSKRHYVTFWNVVILMCTLRRNSLLQRLINCAMFTFTR